ncbi:hypothetical protein ACFL0V_06045 [Nanoarchaeota archaeon]
MKKEQRKILDFILNNPNPTIKEIARQTCLEESITRRHFNSLFIDGLCDTLIMPNYSLLGYRAMAIQKFKLKTQFIPYIADIKHQIMEKWTNCIDCLETFDNNLIVRSVWKDPESFKDARADILTDCNWLEKENVDIIPLHADLPLLRINSLWSDDE